MEAMIFAAGLGTRLKDETGDKPKALVEVGGKTLLQRAIEKTISAGASQVVVNVHHFAEQVKQFIADHSWNVPVLVSDETGLLLETGGGLKKAQAFFTGKETIMLYNVDILCNVDLKSVYKIHSESGALATLLVRQRETMRYFKFNKDMQLIGWINKSNGAQKISRDDNFEQAREFAFSGIHFIQPELFNYMPPEERFPIIQLYLELAKTKTIKGFVDESDLWMDVGKPAELIAARKMFEGL